MKILPVGVGSDAHEQGCRWTAVTKLVVIGCSFANTPKSRPVALTQKL